MTFEIHDISASREPASDHVACDAAGQVAGSKGAACEVGGLAEFVAAGEGQGVHNGEDEGDDCGWFVSVSILAFMSNRFLFSLSLCLVLAGGRMTDNPPKTR